MSRPQLKVGDDPHSGILWGSCFRVNFGSARPANPHLPIMQALYSSLSGLAIDRLHPP